MTFRKDTPDPKPTTPKPAPVKDGDKIPASPLNKNSGMEKPKNF